MFHGENNDPDRPRGFRSLTNRNFDPDFVSTCICFIGKTTTDRECIHKVKNVIERIKLTLRLTSVAPVGSWRFTDPK